MPITNGDNMSNDANQDLILQEIYFQKINFTQIRGGQAGEIKLQVKNNFEFAKSNDGQNLRTTIATTIQDEVGRLSLDIACVGVFKLNNNANQEDPKYAQVMVNTLWPFMRTQISLVTTQPGITPVMIPLQTPLVNQPKDTHDILA